MKIGLCITNHSSQKIRPYGRDLLVNAFQSFIKNCKYNFEIIIVDNQSDFRLDNSSHELLTNSNVHYIYVEDQWKRGLTGAWNEGIKKAVELNCDIILNSNDDLIFNESINDFIEKIILNEHKDISVFGPLTNGVNGSFVKIQYSENTNPNLSKEIGNFKSFAARSIIDLLQKNNAEYILN
jgi:glycosyltransferase involved in cell wall biosynthesis